MSRTILTKICYRCKQEKPTSEFYPNKRRKYSHICKECERNRGKSRYRRSAVFKATQAKRDEEARLLESGLKKCTGCLKVKPLVEFPGKWKDVSGVLSAKCQQCETKRHAEWVGRNRKELRIYKKSRYDQNPEHECLYAREQNEKHRSADNPFYVLRRLAQHTVRRVPGDNPITPDYLMELFEANEGKCAISGMKMTWGPGYCTATSISVDRIDSDKGYSIGNVRLVCYAVNAFQHRMTDAEMLEMAKAIVRHMEQRDNVRQDRHPG